MIFLIELCSVSNLLNLYVDPEWASTTLGVFICERCANIHKMLESRISKVKAIRLDKWEEDQLLVRNTFTKRQKYHL